MPKRRNRPRASTWLAMLGVVLQTLWPVISTGNEILDEFSHAAQHAGHEADGDADAHGAPAQHHGSHKSHCEFCSSTAVCAVLPPAGIAVTGESCSADAVASLTRDTPPRASLVHRPANPRAPPALS